MLLKVSGKENTGAMPPVTEEVDIFGYRVSARGICGDVRLSRHFVAADRKNCRYMACANPHSLVVASRDSFFKEALQQSDLLLPDGTGIVLASRALNHKRVERVAGFEFFHGLTTSLELSGGARYFFLGSSDEVLDLIKIRIGREFPSMTVCGTLSPPFKTEFTDAENRRIVSTINESQPDVLWVGMTAPKQEKWIYRNRNKLTVPFIAGIGAVFDFYAGTKKRSSVFWQKVGLEWLPRFLHEPRRLWERNMRSTPIFLYWIAREKYKILFKR